MIIQSLPRLISSIIAMYLAVNQAAMDISIREKMRRVPKATKFRMFEISWFGT